MSAPTRRKQQISPLLSPMLSPSENDDLSLDSKQDVEMSSLMQDDRPPSGSKTAPAFDSLEIRARARRSRRPIRTSRACINILGASSCVVILVFLVWLASREHLKQRVIEAWNEN